MELEDSAKVSRNNLIVRVVHRRKAAEILRSEVHCPVSSLEREAEINTAPFFSPKRRKRITET